MTTNKIQTLHKAMQVINAAHKEAKSEIYVIIDELIKENATLAEMVSMQAEKIKALEARSGSPVTVTGQLNLVDAEDHPIAEPETVTHTVDPEKVKAKQEEDERISLVQALVSEKIIRNAHPTQGELQMHRETTKRLAEVVGLLPPKPVTERPETQPILLVAKDSTGSMGAWESYIAQCVAHWTKLMLEVKHNSTVYARYITFNKDGGVEVPFEECFVKGADGGTLISPAVKMLNTMADDYDYEDGHDVYVLLLSDGDNLQSDNQPMVKQLERLAPKTKKLWYVEMNQYNRLSHVMSAYNKKENPDAPTKPENMSTHIIQGNQKVYTELFEMFKEE